MTRKTVKNPSHYKNQNSLISQMHRVNETPNNYNFSLYFFKNCEFALISNFGWDADAARKFVNGYATTHDVISFGCLNFPKQA